MYVHPELAGILGRLPARPAGPYADIKAIRADFKAMMAPLMRGDPRVAVEHADSPFFTLPRMNRAICGDSEMFICSMAIVSCSCRQLSQFRLRLINNSQ